MRLSQCLLPAACLSAAVTAFIPYSFKIKTLPLEPSGGSLGRRFVPLKLLSGDIPEIDVQASSSSSDDLLTLDLKKVPVRRDNVYQVVLAETPDSSGTVALNQDGLDYSYFVTAHVGTPGQPVWLLLDTGGANTWVFGSGCRSGPCQMHNTFSESSSSTVQVTTDKFEVGYGSGNVSGVLVTDHISVANLNVEMAFGLANQSTDDFRNYPIDGILGLGRSDDTSMGGPAFMDVVAKQMDLKSNIVSFSLSRNSDGARDGTATFGGVDTTKFTGDITYTDVANNSIHWSIPLDDASVDGRACEFSDKFGILDTGTSYTLIPPKDAEALHALIPDSRRLSDENFAIPCDSTAVVQVTFSGVSYTISPRDYIGGHLEPAGSGCISTLIGQAVFGDDVWILGDNFLKNVYSVFDFDNDRIGLAHRFDSSSETTTAAVATPTDTFATETVSSDSADTVTTTNPTETSEFKGTGTTFGVPTYYWPTLAGLLYLPYI